MEPDNLHTISPETTSNINPTSPAGKKSNVPVIALIILLIITAAAGVFIYAKYASLKNTINKPAIITDNNPQPAATTIATPTATPTVSPTTSTQKDTVTYTNAKLGFSLDIPVQAANLYGACELVKTPGKPDSYRPKTDFTPVTTFEKPGSVYIAFAYNYALTKPTTVGGTKYFGGCEKTPETIANLDSERRTWQIVEKDVKDDTELTAFIKQRFGTGCSIGTKTLSSQSNVYDVKVKSDGLDMEFSKCVLNYMFYIKYAPTINKVFTFDLGQAAAFYKSTDFMGAYDDTMQSSFKVIFP
jgi:hypothetical protein